MAPVQFNRMRVGASNRERGQSLLLVSLSLLVLFGFFALAIDVGYLQTTRRQAQSAADAAAMAGAREVLFAQACTSGIPTAVKNAALDSAKQNAFQNGVGGVAVAVNCPPLLGVNAGNNNAVEVIVSKSESTFFMGMFGKSAFTVNARAVGTLSPSPFCIQTTGPVGEGIDIDGGFFLNAPTCGIMVNSTNTGPTNSLGEQSITTHPGGGCGQAPNLMVKASVIATAAAYYAEGVCTSPQPTFNAVQLPDQLGYLPQPTPGTCSSYTGTKITTNTTLNHGTYCGGIWVTNNATVTLNPGTYVLYGGSTMGGGAASGGGGRGGPGGGGPGGTTTWHSLEVDGGSTLTGTGGVTFFNYGTKSPYLDAGTPTAGEWGSILLCTATGPNPACSSGEATVNLAAPTSGTYAGILFFDARTLPNSNSNFTTDQFSPCGGTNQQHETCAKGPMGFMGNFTGGANQTFNGTFYFPTTILNYTGNATASTSNCSPFIGWILLWNVPTAGQGLTVTANCSSLSGGNPLKTASLGE